MIELINNSLKGFRFESPWYLLLIMLFISLLVLAINRRKPVLTVPWIKPFLLSKQGQGKSFSVIPIIIYFITAVLLTIALARPQKGIEQLKQKASGIDIMLVLDLSGSMQAIDIPSNMSPTEIRAALEDGSLRQRIDYSKEAIQRLVEKRPNDRIGLEVFGPKAYLASPPTMDHTFLLAHIKNVSPGIVGDSTNIAAPIASAVIRLKDASSKRRVIVLFTDGSNNVNDRISPLQAVKLAKMYNITIYTVGLGSNNALVSQNTPFGPQFMSVYGQFDEKLMNEMANITGGRYFKAADSEGLKRVLSEIDRLEKTTVESPRFVDYSEYGPRIIVIAIFIFVLGFVSENIFFIRTP